MFTQKFNDREHFEQYRGLKEYIMDTPRSFPCIAILFPQGGKHSDCLYQRAIYIYRVKRGPLEALAWDVENFMKETNRQAWVRDIGHR